MATHDLKIGDIESTLRADILLATTLPPVDLEADLEVYAGGIVPEPYIVVQGYPQRDKGLGASIGTRSGATISSTATSPTAATAQLSSTHRWLVRPDRFVEGGTRWFPEGSGFGGPAIFFPTVSPHKDPRPDYAYDYESTKGTRRQPALTFNGSGYGHLYVAPEGQPRRGSATFAIVAVMNASKLPYYGIFEADQRDTNSKGEPLVLRYTHGRLDVFQNEQRVVVHQTKAAVNEALLLMVSFDAATDSGLLVVRDASSASRTFTAQGLDFISFYGVIGALGQGSAESPYRFRSFMDVLELDYWDRALSPEEAGAQADLLALAYGIGPG